MGRWRPGEGVAVNDGGTVVLFSARSAGRSRPLIVVLVALLLAFSFLAAPSAAAKEKRELTVMTQNVYLGSSLAPAIGATTLPELLGAVATIFGTVQFTDFSVRSDAIADEIADHRPDLIGLQEVSEWTTTGPTLSGIDFLDVLLQDLTDRGLSYSVAAVSENALIGPLPLVVPCAGPLGACMITFQDRDVILVNDDTPELEVFNPQNALYEVQAVIPSPAGDLSFDRGWASVDGTFDGKKFRFVNTHFETEAFPDEQEAQAEEFLAGPAKVGGAVIAVGDFNSAADGTTTASYSMLTKSYFDDAWDTAGGGVGFTCCQNGTLTNPVSGLSSRIDLVLTHGASRAQQVEVVGSVPFQTVPPLWPSDHAGVVSVVRIH
jgi:endonuclease/exonuclease/phosphatase family metal-dependent hydrolase